MTVINFPERGIETAKRDDRVYEMAVDVALGIYTIEQAMLAHKMNAIEVAHDHRIGVTDVQKACELRIMAALEAGQRRGD